MKNKLIFGLANNELVPARKIDANILIEEFGENYGETRLENDGDGGQFSFRYFPISDLPMLLDVFGEIALEK